MIIAKVVGSVVSTIKDEALHGSKLLVLREASPDAHDLGDPFVAVDTVGAGTGELVLVARGSAARQTRQTNDAPVDSVIIAVIDSLDVEGTETFRKS